MQLFQTIQGSHSNIVIGQIKLFIVYFCVHFSFLHYYHISFSPHLNPKAKCFLWVVCLPLNLLLNCWMLKFVVWLQREKWNEVDSTTQQQTIKQSIKCSRLNHILLSACEAPTHTFSLSLSYDPKQFIVFWLQSLYGD